MKSGLKKIFVSVVFLVTFLCAFLSVANETWVPVQDVSLMIEPGSILDFSELLPPAKPIQTHIVINQDGHFAFEDQPEKSQRFLIGSLGFSVATGSFPSHATIDLYAQQFRMHGYNMARLDFVEEVLMTGRKKDFDYNPEQLDRFYYMVAAFKKNGIYLILNGLSSGNGGYGNIAERWMGQKGLDHRVYFDAEAQTHWKKLISSMYGGVNPYTGISVLQDPTLAGLILANENNLAFANRNGVHAAFKPHFSQWLKSKYGSNTALKVAWGSELKADENIELNQIDFPKPDVGPSKRMSDAQQFFFESEKKTADWMTQYLRQQGFKGQVTAYNVWNSAAANAARGHFEWVDMHNYFAHPQNEGSQIKVRQDSMLQDHAGYVMGLAVTKHLGKAFTVSEHGQIFWNQYRRENGIALPAYAALQSWDGICQHAHAIALSYAQHVSSDKNLINAFRVGQDPIARASETLSALLYLRGDVSPARSNVRVKFTPQDAFVEGAHLGGTPNEIAKISLVTGLGLNWSTNQKKQTKSVALANAEVSFSQPGIKLLQNSDAQSLVNDADFSLNLDRFSKQYASNPAYKNNKINLIAHQGWAARVQNLRDSKIINHHNLTNAKANIFQSDTGEILLDSPQKRMVVITKKTEAIVFDEPTPIELNQLSVLSADSAALVAVSAMDDQPLATSKRMLLILSTDARNTDMQFTDASNQVVSSMGKLPVVMRAVKLKLALKTPYKSKLKIYSLNLRGQRQDAMNMQQTDASIEFELDIGRLSHGATTYFEISL